MTIHIDQDFFYDMIKALRTEGALVLYQNLPGIQQEEKDKVVEFLRSEYEREKLNYPFEAPPFDEAAALWGAELVYLTAQLILFRENKGSDLGKILPKDHQQADASSILSVDLCLRFLPTLVNELKNIDPDDELLDILEQLLLKWHYSAISYSQNWKETNLSVVLSNNCLRQLYVDRIIKHKNILLAEKEELFPWVKAALGMYAKQFWPNFETITTHE
ncbi:MAG: hypothetical protein AAFY71_14815 [Bacteroidota bacterium]